MPKIDLRNPGHPLVLAHRGGKFWQARDFSHIEQAVKEGAHIIDFDVRKRKGEYVVQHDYFHRPQGLLKDALKKIPGQTVYLDIKGFKVDPNHLIRFARRHGAGDIIIGSFSRKILRKVKKKKGVYTCFNSFGVLCPVKIAKDVNADWISITSFCTRQKLIQKIVENEFKYLATPKLFRSKKREDFSHHLKNIAHGAHMVALYNVDTFLKEVQDVSDSIISGDLFVSSTNQDLCSHNK